MEVSFQCIERERRHEQYRGEREKAELEKYIDDVQTSPAPSNGISNRPSASILSKIFCLDLACLTKFA